MENTELAGFEDANGLYTNGKIILPLDAQGGFMSVYAGHEVFHYLEENASETASKLKSFIIETLKADAAYDYDAEFAKISELYGFDKLSEAEQKSKVESEMAGNACFGVLSQRENFEELVKQDRSLAKKVLDFFSEFFSKIEEALRELAGTNAEYRSIHNDVEAQKQIVDMMKECLNEAQGNNAEVNGEAQYARRNVEEYEYLSAFEDENEQSIMEREKAKLEKGKEYEYGEKAYYDMLLKDGKHKYICFSGTVNGTLDVHSVYIFEDLGYNYDEVINTINDLEEYDSAEDLIYKRLRSWENSSGKIFQRYLREADRFIRSGEWSSKYRRKYLQSLAKGKHNRKGTAATNGAAYSLRQSYMQAAEQGDEATAQKYVDEAAMKWGAYSVDGKTPLKLYHGTQSFGFTEFDLNRMDDKRSIFLTSDIDTAQSYSGIKAERKIIERRNYEKEVREMSLDDVALKLNQYNRIRKNVYVTDFVIIDNDYIDRMERNTKAIEAFGGDYSVHYKFIENAREALKSESKLIRNNNTGELFTREEANNKLLEYFKQYGRSSEKGNYALYAKLENPLVVDCHGNNWHNIGWLGENWRDSNGKPAENIKEYRTTRQVAKYAYENDYDGVIFKNIKDDGGRGTEPGIADYIAVAFKPENVKSADAVTYDNNNEIIPLEERFNEKNADIRYAKRENEKYSYEYFKTKPDMKVTSINDKNDYSVGKAKRESVVNDGINSALSVGHKDKQGNIFVYVDDIDTNILVSKKSLRHSLDRRFSIIAPVTENIGPILKNAIRINELIPKSDNTEKSYALIGIAKNQNNEPYVVSFIVNSTTNEIASIDVLYAVNAKKEATALIEPELSSQSDVSLTASSISITNLLDYVNKYYPDILPLDVLEHYGYSEIPEGTLGETAIYARREDLTPMGRVAVDLLNENEVLQEAMTNLKKRLEVVTARNENLKKEFHTSKHYLDQKFINKYCDELLKEYHSTYNKNRLRSQVSALFDYMANKGKRVNEEYLFRETKDIATNILNNSVWKDTEIFDQYSGLRKMIQTTRIWVPESVRNQITDYNGFRNAEATGMDIIEAIESRDTYATEDWLILITTDHGGIKRNHGGPSFEERITFIVSNKSIK